MIKNIYVVKHTVYSKFKNKAFSQDRENKNGIKNPKTYNPNVFTKNYLVLAN